MSNTSNGTLDPFSIGTPDRPSRKIKLFGADDKEIDLTEVGSSGEESPFEDSYFDAVGDWLGKHGPAISHLFLIIGSAFGTVSNAWHLSHMDSVSIWQLVFGVLLFCGLIVECAFAVSWLKRGSTDLAGNQLVTVKKLYDRSSIVMIGDLSLSLAEVALGIGGIAAFWVGCVQPIFSVHLVRLFFQLKGEHPMTIARQRVGTLKARMAAGEVENEAQALQLILDEERHNRFMQRASLEQRIAAGEALVSSRWFRSQIKRAVKDSVGKSLLPNVRAKLANLPNLLRLNRSQKN